MIEERELRMKRSEHFAIWQVTVSADYETDSTERKHHFFSNMYKATRFIHNWINRYADTTGCYPVGSVNLSVQSSAAYSPLPSRIDNMRFEDFMNQRRR